MSEAESIGVTADLLVIGFGKGGKTLAATMGREGKKVVMVEQSDQMYGGTCINIGCIPTKALVHRADVRRPGDERQSWYQDAIGAVTDLTTMMRGKNFQMLDTLDTVTVVTGKASFLDSTTVEVAAGDDRLAISAGTIVINTGSVPVIPDIRGLRKSEYMATSTDLLHTEKLPRHLAVIGGGYLGLEFAAMYRQFGSEVSVLEAFPKFVGREDDDVAEVVVGIFRDQGITLITDAKVTEVEDGSADATIYYEVDGRPRTLKADKILVATGRVPAIEGLGLDRAGIRTTEGGAIEVDEHLRTSQPHIYAIGDVNGGPMFTYISLDDYRIVADRLLGDGRRSTADRVAVPHTMFITPPFSTVGLTETAARERGYNVRIAAKPVAQTTATPRARIIGDTRGLIKFVIDADTDLILGAALISIDSQEVINLVAFAMRHDVPAGELGNAIYSHPSTTEGFNELLGTVARVRVAVSTADLENA
ncbi:pyridine nucleotide-disulfide oxidoreductase [Planotetraspora thailandica]|uniref:Pyridine nucleotide-disulfide oxidoreductase n=1 Tax=Planotetraspora thailandica TaxID=487172 RepID=A0A8J3Y196_9ACTN|nr:FAD-dependent oxidoreductase [Planotetraspora thailandica]GII59013.1 pyridine nucleotide-disulfide oxidoreductase [Planotetraspora thailandica]